MDGLGWLCQNRSMQEIRHNFAHAFGWPGLPVTSRVGDKKQGRTGPWHYRKTASNGKSKKRRQYLPVLPPFLRLLQSRSFHHVSGRDSVVPLPESRKSSTCSPEPEPSPPGAPSPQAHPAPEYAHPCCVAAGECACLWANERPPRPSRQPQPVFPGQGSAGAE